MDKGTLSNVISTCVFVLGLLLPHGEVQAVVLSAGMFAFSGGVTNWLAVKMLFDRIPGLVGSGVIPARFREIRAKVKDLIIEHFFDEDYLRQFFAEHGRDIDWKRYIKKPDGDGGGPLDDFVKKQWEKLTSVESIQPIIDSQLTRLTESSIGGMLLMVGLENVRPAVNQFVSAFIASLQAKVLRAAREHDVEVAVELDDEAVVEDIRAQVGPLLEKRLEQIHAADVKRMMEDVMRHHLGWLIVWGNVFGGILGLVAYIVQRNVR